MSARSVYLATVLLLAVGVSAAPAAETAGDQPNESKIWSGVFTAAQAQRGKTSYERSCSNCHTADLSGSVRAPSLRGDRFLQNWQNGSVDTLFVKLRDSMPANYPDTVPEATKIDILSYLLQQNGFPAGASELTPDEKELADIEIAKKGGQAAANFSLVRIVGCLTPGPNNGWTLTKAGEPVSTRDESAAPSTLAAAASSPLGSGTFRLISASSFQPDLHRGQKVEARGLVYRQPDENLLNLTSLAVAGAGCGN